MSRSGIRVLGAGLAAMAVVLSACSGGSSSAAGGRQTLQLWFWGASPQQQKTMQSVLVDGFDKSQSKYHLEVTFNNAVDKNVQVALSANKGPDIVYGSGPSFSAAYAVQGKLADMTPYAEKYGWKDRILAPMYDSGTVNGKLYSLPNSLENLGIFYNKKVLDKLGVGVPTTFAELTADMDKAAKAGMYPSVTGNKGWKPVNQNYISMFLTHVAGGKAVYDALQGEIKWTDPKIVEAVNDSADFYKKGYLGGEDYANLNFTESMQLLAQGKSPFFFGPTLAFQFASDYFNDAAGNTSDLGFAPFPNVTAGLPSPSGTLGTTASLSINAHSSNKDGAAEVIDYMMSEKFAQEMNKTWPGYWGVPLKDWDLDPASYTGLSKEFVQSVKDTVDMVSTGDYGFFAGTFFPPATATAFTDVDGVWLGTESTTDFLKKVQSTFDDEKAKGLVPPVPEPAG
ncbi:ABC transporter substrate-binding protein [Streptomyces sp. NBC_00038]|uniref:ABC transporter substrate-binding protein n=1 Tax=Streptomyces sp. NBC_00038 TaxID=2903615 RepID=UPI002258391B|nr:extracellular solute-binding protein [Streptomyces sp. NBC_00038]MCX5554471.1 extracellular solute-binding protein [Streptomyces sp. NBC_00038]